MSSLGIGLEQTTQDVPEPRRVALFGGGRWARILLQELVKAIPGDTQVVWISKNLFAASRAWLSEQSWPNVRVQSSWNSASESFDAAIVATNVPQHFELNKRLLEQGIPTLCEKPVASSIDELELLTRLSSQLRVPFGVHLEFLYFKPIQQMSALLSNCLVEEIEVLWQDPWVEERSGQLKMSEVGTDVLNDQFPHVWSVICGLTSIDAKLDFTSSTILNNGVKIQGWAGGVRFEAMLGRRAAERVRRVVINRGEATLDFSCTPCLLQIGNQVLDTERWEHRTLYDSLTSFLQVAQRWSHSDGQADEKRWPLSVQTHLAMLARCIETADLMSIDRQLEIDRLERMQRIDLNDREQVALILDCYLPRLARSGMHLVPVSMQDQVLVAAEIMKRRRDSPPGERQ